MRTSGSEFYFGIVLITPQDLPESGATLLGEGTCMAHHGWAWAAAHV